jgi:hypothetical protein
MLTARHSAIIRCAKSRHTPCFCRSVSTADVVPDELPETKATLRLTQSQIACTRP